MKLWIGNIAPGTTDDELKAFLKKYAPELECSEIQRVEGSGTHPSAMLSFAGTTTLQLGSLAQRLNGMYWNGQSLTCSTVLA